MTWWPAVIVAFLIGSIPFGYLIGRAKGVDIRALGSGNIGASNLGRVLGSRFFFICFLLDMLKGLIPTLLAGRRAGILGDFAVPADQAWWWLAVMAATVLGHMFSPWLGFRGGKGVATGLGALLGVFPPLTLPAVGALGVFILVLSLWRYISAASVTAAASLPLWTWYAHRQYESFLEMRLAAEPHSASVPAVEIKDAVPFTGWPFVAVAGALGALVIYKHRANLSRLWAGVEPRIGHRDRPSRPTATDPNPPVPPSSQANAAHDTLDAGDKTSPVTPPGDPRKL